MSAWLSWYLSHTEAVGVVMFVLGGALGYGIAAGPRDEKIKDLQRSLSYHENRSA